MQPRTDSAVPHSPLNCSSHRHSLPQENVKTGSRVGIKTIIRSIRSDDAMLCHSPPAGRRTSHYLVDRVPMAPKPELEINNDNILFANRKRLSRSAQPWLSELRDSRSGSLECRSDLGNMSHPGGSCSGPNYSLQRTSTPFMWRYNTRRDIDERVNSALLGAPRLALSLSMENSSNDELEQSMSRVLMPSSSQESVSIDDHIETQIDFEAPRSSPNVACVAVAPVGEAKPFSPSRKLKRPTEASISPFRCRICLEEGDTEEVLLSPCRCKGTVGLVHHHCLRRWVLESGKPQCELCGYAYILTPSKRASGASTTIHQNNHFKAWLSHQFTRRHLIIDMVCLILLMPSTILGVHFLVLGALSMTEQNLSGWQVSALWTLAVLLVLLLIIWTVLAIRHHVNSYQEFRDYQTLRACDETARQAALPFRRFSIQTRQRGSSVMMATCSTPPSGPLARRCGSTVATGDSPVHGQSSPDSSSPTQIPGGPPLARAESNSSVGVTTPTNPRLHVSFALTAVPEVTEECMGGVHTISASYV